MKFDNPPAWESKMLKAAKKNDAVAADDCLLTVNRYVTGSLQGQNRKSLRWIARSLARVLTRFNKGCEKGCLSEEFLRLSGYIKGCLFAIRSVEASMPDPVLHEIVDDNESYRIILIRLRERRCLMTHSSHLAPLLGSNKGEFPKVIERLVNLMLVSKTYGGKYLDYTITAAGELVIEQYRAKGE